MFSLDKLELNGKLDPVPAIGESIGRNPYVAFCCWVNASKVSNIGSVAICMLSCDELISDMEEILPAGMLRGP